MEMNMGKFSEKLVELLELAKKKKNVLEYQEINDHFKDFPLEPEQMDAIGILTITPSEGAIIAADIATKASDITLGFIDRFSGALVFTGDISSVEAAVKEILETMEEHLGFAKAPVTRT